MPRTTKKHESHAEAGLAALAEAVASVKSITPLDLNLGREDLNVVVAKLNEVINLLNS
jgi:hypothetical protein